MNHFKTLTQASCIAIFASMSASLPAQANKVTKNTVESPKTSIRIDVYSSDGESWDRVRKDKVHELKLPGSFSCEFGNDNKAKYYNLSFLMDGMKQVSGSLSPKPYDPKKQIKASFRYEEPARGFDPIEVCEIELEKRLSNQPGRSKYEVLAKTYPVFVKSALQGNFQAVCEPTFLGATDLDNTTINVDVEVMCEGSPLAKDKLPKPKPEPIQTMDMKLSDLVTDANFYALQDTVVGTCPANVELIGWMKFSRPGSVKYRYVSHDEKVSPVLTAKTDKSGRVLTRKWSTTLKAPDDDGPKWANEQAEGDTTVLKGWHRLEFLEPAGLPSLTANYSAVCTQEMELALPESDNSERSLRKRPGRAKFGDTGN